MTDAEIIKLVKKTLKKVRPYLQADGGDVDFIKFEDGIVYVSLIGACDGCSMINETLDAGIGIILKEEVPGVIDVRTTASKEENKKAE